MRSLHVDIHELDHRYVIWQTYDPTVKADLSSTAVNTDRGRYIIDPVSLPPNAVQALVGTAITAIIVTNENHARATAEFSEKLSLPVFAHFRAEPALAGISVTPITEGTSAVPGLEVIELSGGARGEIALHDRTEGGTLVIGDALINFGSTGFGLLPAKYCEDQKRLRKSLHKLLQLEFGRMLFAHGAPILSNARARLAELLDGET